MRNSSATETKSLSLIRPRAFTTAARSTPSLSLGRISLSLSLTCSLVVALVLSNLVLSSGSGMGFGTQGTRGLPVPYQYTDFTTFPYSQNNWLYALDFFFWIVLLNLGINYYQLRKAKKPKGKLIDKEFMAMLIVSVILFLVSLVFFLAFR